MNLLSFIANVKLIWIDIECLACNESLEKKQSNFCSSPVSHRLERLLKFLHQHTNKTNDRGNRFESSVSCRLIFITKRFYSNALFDTNLETGVRGTGATPVNISGRGHVSWRICSISKGWGRWLGTTLSKHPPTYQWKNCFSQLWNLKRYYQIILLCMYFKIENIFVVKWKWLVLS